MKRARSRRLANRALACLAVLTTLLQGCVASRSVPAPLQTPPAQTLLDSLAVRRQQLSGLRTIARLRYRSPAGNESARHVLAVQRPDRLRVEVLSILGTMFALTSEAGRIAAYVPGESTFYTGRASTRNISRYLPIGISIPLLIDHILSTPPLAFDRPTRVDIDDRLIRVSQRTADGQHAAWFRDGATPVSYRRWNESGAVVVEALYDDFATKDVVPIATRVTLRFPPSQESIEVSLRDPEINPHVSESFFSLEIPPDARIVDLDA